MSEYRYYEFQAIDRPLTASEMDTIRSYSTRARITATSFVNEYSWGDFKGDVDAWMEKYFDAFLYVANWGTHVLKLRISSRLLAPAIVDKYACGDSFFVHSNADSLVMSLVAEDEDVSDWVEAEGQLSSMVSIRAELERGDLRALYIGWLRLVQHYELDDEELEPPMPAGLGQLSASLLSLAEFLRIDSDLLAVAASTSPPLREEELDRVDLEAWVAALPESAKDEIILGLMLDGDRTVISELRLRYAKETKRLPASASSSRRTVGELLAAAEAYAEGRRRREAEQEAEEETRRARQAALAREKRLDGLVGRESEMWAQIERLVATKQGKKYDDAVRLLVDLRDVAARCRSGEFGIQLERFRQKHTRKPGLLKRLDERFPHRDSELFIPGLSPRD